MKKLILSLFVICAISSCTRVAPSEIGIKVYLLGSSKGEFEMLGTGRHWIGFNEEIKMFPRHNVLYKWTVGKDDSSPNDESFDFQDKEGLAFRNVELGLEFMIVPDSAIHIYSSYRKGIDDLVDHIIKNRVTKAFNNIGSQMSAVEIMSEKASLLQAVLDTVKSSCEPDGIIIKDLHWIGNLNPPALVNTAIENKVKAEQDAMQRNNEIQSTIAEAKKKIESARGDSLSYVIRAGGQSTANKMLEQTLTKGVIKSKYLDKWDGKEPQTILSKEASVYYQISN
jgi:hypothetical protein